MKKGVFRQLLRPIAIIPITANTKTITMYPSAVLRHPAGGSAAISRLSYTISRSRSARIMESALPVLATSSLCRYIAIQTARTLYSLPAFLCEKVPMSSHLTLQ